MIRGKTTVKRNKAVIIGLACGVLCAACVGLFVLQVDADSKASQAEMLAKYGGDQVEVCVAKRNIATGDVITESDIETKMWIASMLPGNAVMNKDEAIGKQVGSTIIAGEVISSVRFGFDAADIEVPDGLVAVSVPARDVQAVGGALEPGMKADIYSVGASSTACIASRVPILETCSNSGSSSNAWITLAVDPNKVTELISAAQNTELYFTLPSSTLEIQDEGKIDPAAHISSNSLKIEDDIDSGLDSDSNSSLEAADDQYENGLETQYGSDQSSLGVVPANSDTPLSSMEGSNE